MAAAVLRDLMAEASVLLVLEAVQVVAGKSDCLR